jgi:hypothetical protein
MFEANERTVNGGTASELCLPDDKVTGGPSGDAMLDPCAFALLPGQAALFQYFRSATNVMRCVTNS